MWAPLRKGDLFRPPYVAPLGVPRQPPGGGVTRPRATGPSSSVPLEELDGALVLEGSFAGPERSQIPSSARARILLPGIQTILPRWQLPDHRSSPRGLDGPGLRTRRSALSRTFSPAAIRRIPRRH